MSNRYVPFGYEFKNAGIVIKEDEAELVKSAFELYSQDKSFSEIAKRFSLTGIRYHNDTDKWNKNMIKRMIENAKYTGNEEYPKIIDQKLYYKANKKRLSKNVLQNEDKAEYDKFVRENSVCAMCQSPIKRQNQGQAKSRRTVFKCTNPICPSKSIEEKTLYSIIAKMINRMIENTDTVNPQECPNPPPNETIEELTDSIYLKIAEGNYDKDSMFESMYELASLKFKNCIKTDMSEITKDIKRELSKYAPSPKAPITLMQKIIDKIYVSKDEVKICLKNGKERSDKDE